MEFDYKMDNVVIPSVNQIRDLGVMVSSDLKSLVHVGHITAKAYQRVNLIFRCMVSKDPKFLTKIYKAYVRPILEYNVSVWSPYQRYLVDKLEKVQRSFTKRLRGMRELSYEQRLLETGLEKLVIRRLRYDLVHIYKMLSLGQGFEPFFTYDTNVRTRGNSRKLRVNFIPRNETSKNFFLFRTVKIWNQLNDDIVNAASLESFKNKLTESLLSQWI